MFVLRNHTNCPPGQFVYRQDHNGTQHKFGPSPLINEVAKAISQFRTGNKLARADLRSCIEDVDRYTCQRLGGNARWCLDTDKTYAEVRPVKTGCGGCGAKVK